VAVIFQLAHTGLTAVWDVGRVVALFIPVWIVWAHTTFYTNLFDTDDLAHRFFAYVYFLGVGAIPTRACTQTQTHSDALTTTPTQPDWACRSLMASTSATFSSSCALCSRASSSS
jgi:hypothetical protein